MNKTTTNTAIGIGLAVAALLGFAVAMPGISNAQSSNECVFTKDLEFGVISEEVRCLQKYLNSKGFLVAAVGVGAPGNETNVFKDATEAAVKKWQEAKGVTPASGYFGSISRTKYYDELIGTTIGGSNTTIVKDPIASQTPSPITTPIISIPTVSGAEADARNRIIMAKDNLKELRNEISDAEDDDREIEDADEDAEEAEEYIIDALYAFIDREYGEAKANAEDAISILKDAEDKIEEGDDDDDDELTRADAIVFDNETVVTVKYKGKTTVFTTEETREDDIVDAIIDEIDDDLTGKQVEQVLEIEIEDRDSRPSDKDNDSEDNEDADEDDAQDAIDDADDAIEEAEDEIDEAEEDGDDTSDAEDLLDEAKDLLADAEDAFDDEDYEDALELAEEAQELAEEAIDEL